MNINKQFENNGYKLIGKYKNVHNPCLCACKFCGNKKKICLHLLKKIKIKCRQCYDNEIKIFFENQGCILLSEPSRSKKNDYICSCGTKHSIMWLDFKKGTRCRKCFHKKLIEKNPKKQKIKKEIYNYFKEQGCELIDEYENQLKYLNFICSCGKKDKVRWKQFRKGSRCTDCTKKRIKNRHVPSGKNHFRWNPNREEVNLRKTIRSRIKKSLKRVLRNLNKEKIKKTWDHLGYSRDELFNHIINHPNWHKVKKIEWELDHKFPIKAFFDHKIYDEKIINSLKNLQPLTKKQNRSKNDNYNKKDFLKFLENLQLEIV